MDMRVRKLPHLILCCGLLATCMMVTVFVVKAPHTSFAYLLMATPFEFMFGAWIGYRGLAGALDTSRADQPRTGDGPAFGSLHEKAAILATFAFFGIAISLTMGFMLGRLSAH